MMIQLALLLQYNGANFHGSQIQHHNGLTLRTVQGSLSDAFKNLQIELDKPPLLASRTDQGVHAMGQIASVSLSVERLNRYRDLRRALNSQLPKDLRVQSIEELSNPLHIQLGSQWRWYRYAWHSQPVRSPFSLPNCHWLHTPLNVDVMRETATYFVGTHDFKSYKCPNTVVVDNICTVKEVSVINSPSGIVYFDILANRYLYKMVRNLAGTLEAIGVAHAKTDSLSREERERKYLDPASVLTILGQRNRQAAHHTAHAEGLTLMAIEYPRPLFQSEAPFRTLHHALTADDWTLISMEPSLSS